MKASIGFLLTVIALLLVRPAYGASLADVKNIADANNEFALQLYAQISKQSGNQVFSPFSIDTALAMTYAGAHGSTARQMAEVLHLPNRDTNIHAVYAFLLKEMSRTNNYDCQLIMANSLWAQQGYPFLESFQKCLHEKYNSFLNSVDLTGWPNGFDSEKAALARKQINNWVANKTHGKIKEILPSDIPSPDTRLLLINAIYFKGFWATPFDKTLTKDSMFHVSSKETTSVPMMHIASNFNYAKNENFQMLELPYVTHQFSMVILLPKKTDELQRLEKTLTALMIKQLFQDSKLQEVNVSLPKFKEISEFNLKRPLQSMGMPEAFSGENADFSGITTVKPFFIEAAIHKAYVSVDEKGTEASASTAVDLASAEPEIQSTAINFNADHPFLYLICDNLTGAILFMGRVVDPSKE